MRNGARPKSNRQRYHDRNTNRIDENRMSDLHEDLAEFEQFQETILKEVRKDIVKKVKPKDLLAKHAGIVAGRLITTALTSTDEKTVIAASEKILDRTEGKATENKTVTHKYANMKDEELDALLKSEMADLEDMENRFEQ